MVTGVSRRVPEAMADLAGTLRLVRPVADELGVDLYSAGTHPFAQWSTQLLTPGHRYEELIERTQWWGRQMLIWGVHVHVGVRHRDQVMPVVSVAAQPLPAPAGAVRLVADVVRARTPATPATGR